MAADTFAGLTIEVVPGSVPDEVGLTFSQRIIPGSSIIYVDVAGPTLRRLTLTLYFPDVTDGTVGVAALQAKVGVSAQSLVTATLGTVSCMLIRVAQGQVFPLGEGYATCEFLVGA